VITVARRWRAQTYWQLWLSAGRWPLAARIVEAGIRLVSGRWLQFNAFGAIVTVG
jgi:hypothetical protein